VSLRAYREINLHVTWHVKDNGPVLTDAIQTQTHRFLRARAFDTPGVVFHAVGGTDDHLHLAVSIPPTLLISEWVGKLKRGSSHFINHEIANKAVLQWQAGYGVVAFGSKDLPWVADYVRDQRRHHAEGRLFERLERTDPLEEPADQGPPPDEAR